MVVTEDEGDPGNQGFGYFTVDLGTLPRPATSFTFRNRFVRSSFGTPDCGGEPVERRFSYGVRSITFTVVPNNKAQCKNGGWKTYGVFRNQGDCISYLVHEATKACIFERVAIGPRAFRDKYGVGRFELFAVLHCIQQRVGG